MPGNDTFYKIESLLQSHSAMRTHFNLNMLTFLLHKSQQIMSIRPVYISDLIVGRHNFLCYSETIAMNLYNHYVLVVLFRFNTFM